MPPHCPFIILWGLFVALISGEGSFGPDSFSSQKRWKEKHTWIRHFWVDDFTFTQVRCLGFQKGILRISIAPCIPWPMKTWRSESASTIMHVKAKFKILVVTFHEITGWIVWGSLESRKKLVYFLKKKTQLTEHNWLLFLSYGTPPWRCFEQINTAESEKKKVSLLLSPTSVVLTKIHPNETWLPEDLIIFGYQGWWKSPVFCDKKHIFTKLSGPNHGVQVCTKKNMIDAYLEP